MTSTQPAPLIIAAQPGDTDGLSTPKIVPFQLDGDDRVLIGTRPKTAVMIRLVTTMADDSNPMQQVQGLNHLLRYIVDADTLAYLYGRLEDLDDTFDFLPDSEHPEMPSLMNVLKTLLGVWYGGKSGKQPGSAASPRRTGTSSTAKRPSRASTS